MTIEELEKRKAQLLKQARAKINDITRDTPEEMAERIEAKYDQLMEEVEAIDDKIVDLRSGFKAPQVARGANATGYGVDSGSNEDDHTRAFASWLRSPKSEHTRADLTKVEQRLASGLTGAAGGFVVPEMISTPIMSRARDVNPFRSLARVVNVTTGDVKFPISEADATSGWVGEGGTRSATTEPTLASKVPTFGSAYALVSMTEELAQDSAIDIAQWFADEAGRAMGEAEMAAIISGNGTDKPTGLFNVAPESGADGSRTADALKYLPSGAASTLGTSPADLLIDTYYDLKASYRTNAAWVMNSATAAFVRKLKNGSGDYLWADGIAAGQPSTLLGHRVAIAESMPDIGTNGLPIMFGDFNRGYVIAQRTQLAATPDPYTTPGQVRVYLRYRIGGCTYDENAIRAIKCATS
ncbi:phage major capsid protein [Defluviimonas sp. WL0050]|uniref:Phage major capsid protein n=1 Tax=Albidovulum litorale TaxID=2984134 RepID=A0ABT2ZKE6_9RHOB|nr:phage major capsid protein [Defluviimonas sp. WL0050]MCV2871587.1 phage major capsid protein [Defluviimonas sp. WL0050]